VVSTDAWNENAAATVFSTMKSLFAAAGLVLVLNGPRLAQAGTLFTVPIMVVSPTAIDFGAVPSKTTVTNSFLVENAGGGTLVGKATVSPPFKILSGQSYALKNNEAQIVTIAYTPSEASNDVQTVRFTGANPVDAKVMGRLAASPPNASKRK
jgi:hypothetical protein